MLPNWLVLLAALVYLTGLFLVAYLGDRKGRVLMTGRWRPIIYALTLGVYCTSWTFLGSVGLASKTGLDFLTIYIGPVIVVGFMATFMTRLAKVATAQNSTSIADFLAARYGKNQGVAAMVTLIALVGIIPYIALQLKAISASVEVFLTSGQGSAQVPLLGDMALLVALMLAFFAICFGTRHIDATEHQDGLMLAIAAESLVKLVAFLTVGIWTTFVLFDGFGDLWTQATAHPRIAQVLERGIDPVQWLVMTLLSAFAIVLLPRQFHVGVVENRNTADIRSAAWLFPLYLVLINMFVLPIAAAGLLVFPDGTMDRDLTVVGLPLAQGSGLVAVTALIGGLSAATAMVIVECVALAIMVSNHLVLPFLLQRSRLFARDGQASDIGHLVLAVRRTVIVCTLLLAYTYYRASADAALASIGLLAFAAIAQLAPTFIGAMFWSRGTARGAIAGLLTGLLVWTYALLLPSIAGAEPWIKALVSDSLPGMEALRQTVTLAGIELSPLAQGTFASLGANIAAFVMVSLTRRPTPIERVQASSYVETEDPPIDGGFRFWRTNVTTDDLRQTVARYLGDERTSAAFADFHQRRGRTLDGRQTVDTQVLRFAEHLLASAIGAASARLVLSLMLRRRNVSPKAALKLLDDASAAIQYNRDVLQNALDHAEQGVTVWSADLSLVAWNQAFMKLYDLPPDIMRVGVGLDEIVTFNATRGIYGPGQPDAFVVQRLESFIHETEPVRLRLHPSNRVIEVRTNKLPDGGLLTTYTDISETVAAEEALERANESLERRVQERTEELTRVNGELARAKAEAEEANLSKTRFLAAASHDILQPLNAARIYTTSLVERTPDSAHADLARNVDASLEAVEEILTALLDISRLDSGTMKPELSTFAIGDLFAQLAIEFEPVAASKGLDLTFVPCQVNALSDRRLLRRLLQNLVSNAIKYTPQGRVLVGCRRSNGTLRIEVRDTGLGIPASKQKDVFREFQRLDQGARVARGLGLGLSIVERIARVLDHKLSLTSTPGRGTSFIVEVPISTAVAVPLARSDTPARVPAPLDGLTVLCLDNEPAILDGMRILLTGWGCDVRTAGTIADALAELRELDAASVVLIADYHLDDGEGISAIAQMRALAGADVPAVLLTADRSAPVRQEATAANIQVLNKPVRPGALRATLTQWRMVRQAAE